MSSAIANAQVSKEHPDPAPPSSTRQGRQRRPGPEQGAYSNMDVNANGNRMFRPWNVGNA